MINIPKSITCYVIHSFIHELTTRIIMPYIMLYGNFDGERHNPMNKPTNEMERKTID